jgi:NAD(P)-dependent dehydrogenase (short-subunit alcohol dehydrogenase family)
VKKNLFDFTNKTILITGGSSGIGRATALAFAQQGANIVIGDLNETAAQETVELIKKEGVKSLFVKANVSYAADVKALVEKTVSAFGGLDCAFNNAGVFHAPMSIEDLDEDSFDRVIAIDLKGCFLCMKYELQHMVKAGKGAIVNTASVAGLLPEAGSGAYVAAKHGVIGLTKTAAIEHAHLGIRVNALAPGWVRTAMTKGWDDDKGLNAQMKAAAPMHRGAEPEEMTGMVLFLCSEAASYATGQVYLVDGGQTARGLLPVDPNLISAKA